jgi:hypothetical protein
MDVLQVSAVLIHLFTTSSAFRSRLPLPQFLPSPRVAFEHWEYKALRGLIPVGNVAPSLDMDRVSRIASHGQGGQLHSDLEVLYAFAEAEALEEAISILEVRGDLSSYLYLRFVQTGLTFCPIPLCRNSRISLVRSSALLLSSLRIERMTASLRPLLMPR